MAIGDCSTRGLSESVAIQGESLNRPKLGLGKFCSPKAVDGRQPGSQNLPGDFKRGGNVDVVGTYSKSENYELLLFIVMEACLLVSAKAKPLGRT